MVSTTQEPGARTFSLDANDSVENLIALFANKGLDADDLVAVVGAHTTSKQRKFGTTQSDVGKVLDKTPEVWDVNFYNDC